MPKKKPVEGKPIVHPELAGFELSINEFGEITSNVKVDTLNSFLDKHVDDKKFHFETKETPVIALAKKKQDEDDLDDDDADEDDFDDEDDDLDEIDEDDKDAYEIGDDKHEFEDIEDLVKNMEKDFGKKGKAGDDDDDVLGDEDDFKEEEFLDEYNDDFSEEDKYNFEDE